MSSTNISINIVVLNGERYIRYCIDSVFRQRFTHQDIEVHILDNGSTDNTIALIEEYIPKSDFDKFVLHRGKTNLGMWGGHDELLKHSSGKYVIFLSVDVILHPDFIKNAAQALESDEKIAALQAKIYSYDLDKLNNNLNEFRRIDTCGFNIERSRRITNIGHGEEDRGQYDQRKEVFGVEGAVPVFRRSALEDIRIRLDDGTSEIADHDIFWYGEDLDIAWRLRLAGWKEIYDPSVIAYHDRQTTKNLNISRFSSLPNLGYVQRVAQRRKIPLCKRRLEWRNVRWTFIKNEHIINVLKDSPYILWRELMVLGYTLMFQPGVLAAIPEYIFKIPRMLKKRKYIMTQAKVPASEIRKWMK